MNFNNTMEWHHTVVVPRVPNVIFATHMQQLENVQRSGFLEDLPNKLYKDVLLAAMAAAKKQPDWQFFITHNGGNYSTACNITCKGELLGALGVEHYYARGNGYSAAYRLTLSTPSIRNKAVRKNYVATSNPKHMLKLVLAECIPTPLEDRVRRTAYSAVCTAQQMITDATTYSLDANINPNTLYDFLSERGLWDAYKSVAVTRGSKPDFGTNIERKVTLKAIGDVMEKAKMDSKLVTMTPHGEGYYRNVSAKSRGLEDTPPTFVHDNDISDALRTKIGLIKLSNKGTLVPGVGLRVDDVYIVIED